MNKVSKTVLFASLAVLLLAVFLSAILALKGYASSGAAQGLELGGEPLVPLGKDMALADGKRPFLLYKFSAGQKAFFAQARGRNEGCALEVLLECRSIQKEQKDDAGRFEFGFLYEGDFTGGEKLLPQLLEMPHIEGRFADIHSDKVRLLFCLKKSGDVPAGFYLHSDSSCALAGVGVSEAKIGWAKCSDAGDDAPVFAFGPEGGFVDASFTGADFSLAGDVFAKRNSALELLPKIELSFFPADDCGTAENPVTVGIRMGGEELSVVRAKNLPCMVVQSSSLEEPFSSVELTRNWGMVRSVFMSANDSSLLPLDGEVLKGLPTDLGLVEQWPRSSWRCADYELYEWAEFPSIIFFDFASSEVQDQFFTRLAYFVEKEGFKGTFVDDDFILNNHGYNAHDYGAKSLAEFFTGARLQNIRLNKCELLLQKILEANKIIVRLEDGSFCEGKGAVVSMSRSSSKELRKRFLAHECWHGIYFTNSPFRAAVDELHGRLNPQAREFLELYWANNPNLRYDRRDGFLMKNEFMAYMLQQNPAEAQEYFVRWATDGFMPRMAPALSEYVRQSRAEDFVRMAASLDEWTFARWGLGGGRVWLVIR